MSSLCFLAIPEKIFGHLDLLHRDTLTSGYVVPCDVEALCQDWAFQP